MPQFPKYLDLLLQMRRTIMNGFTSPHKPVLLLAVLKGVASGRIVQNRIVLDNALEHDFEEIWNSLVVGGPQVLRAAEANGEYPFKCKIAYPFYHMGSEPFWNLVKSIEWEKRNEYSVPQIKQFYRYAELDPALFELMKNPATGSTIGDCLKGMI